MRVHLLGIIAIGAAVTLPIGKQAAAQNQHENSGCYVTLYDGKNFQDAHITVTGPAEWQDLHNLPGANGKDWSDEADSLKVGPKASVQTWSKKNFEGSRKSFSPGEEASRLRSEPESMKIACK